MRRIWNVLRETASEYGKDRVPRLSAAIAYYTVFSLAPLLVLVIAVFGLALGADQVREKLVAEFAQLIGDNGAQAIDAMIRGASRHGQGIVASVIGGVVLIIGALGVFSELQSALDTVWEVQPRSGRGLRGILRDRAVAFALILAIGFLLLVSLVLSAGIAAIGHVLGGILPDFQLVLRGLDLLVMFGVTAVLFALMYRTLPDAKVRWSDVWPGAMASAALFAVGRFLIGLYLGKSSLSSAYGAAGSLVVILVWVYYSAQILLIGAEFTQVYARHRGQPIEPKGHAEPLTEKAREEQGMPNRPQHPTPPPRPGMA